jgi:hypothetical protein
MENSTFKLNKSFFSMFEVIESAFGVVSHVADKKEVELEFRETSEVEIPYYSELFGDQSRFS